MQTRALSRTAGPTSRLPVRPASSVARRYAVPASSSIGSSTLALARLLSAWLIARRLLGLTLPRLRRLIADFEPAAPFYFVRGGGHSDLEYAIAEGRGRGIGNGIVRQRHDTAE